MGPVRSTCSTLISTLEDAAYPERLIEEADRVLSPDGVIVVQIPNPYFPIDLHYFLPFYGYLPQCIRTLYRSLFAGQGYAIDYYTMTLSRRALERLFHNHTLIYAENFVYPKEVVPDWLRPWYALYRNSPLRRLFPTGHLFVYRRATSPSEGAAQDQRQIGPLDQDCGPSYDDRRALAALP